MKTYLNDRFDLTRACRRRRCESNGDVREKLPGIARELSDVTGVLWRRGDYLRAYKLLEEAKMMVRDALADMMEDE